MKDLQLGCNALALCTVAPCFKVVELCISHRNAYVGLVMLAREYCFFDIQRTLHRDMFL